MAQTNAIARTEQLANPFRPGNGVPPPYLAGRDALLEEFERFLGETHPPHPNWTLTGIRGTGKTVLLGEFAGRGEGAGWLSVERELGDRHRLEERLVEAVEADCDALIRRCDALAGVGQAVERGLRFLRPRRVMVGDIGVEPAYETEASEPAEALTAALTDLDHALAEADRSGALLLYDEAHLLADDRGREQYPLSSLLAAFGRVQREAPRVRVVLCGLPLTLNLKRARTYAERMFRHVVIANLERGDAWDALGIPLAGSGRTFGLNLIGDIVDQTDGYPYFLQFFGGFLCSRVPRAAIERGDYQALEPILLHELDLAFFEDRYAVAGPGGRRVLDVMARASGAVTVLALRRALPEVGNVDEHIRRLVDRGLVYRLSRGRYDFACRSSGPTSGDGKLTVLTEACEFRSSASARSVSPPFRWNRELIGALPMGRRRVPPLTVIPSGVPPRLPLQPLVMELRALLTCRQVEIEAMDITAIVGPPTRYRHARDGRGSCRRGRLKGGPSG